ncbi:hypothetical protein Dimus_001673 [Dionaea muscipula]
MSSNEQGFPSESEEGKRYELSGKIMLSAIVVLFAVVLIMVFLHLYARWYLLRSRRRHERRRSRRRTHLVFHLDSFGTASTAANRGLDSSLVKTIQTFTYSSAAAAASKAASGGEEAGVLECSVCLSEFEDGEAGRILPKCRHCFHVDCIDMWFHSHSTCPLCRGPVDAEMPPLREDIIPADTVVVEIAAEQATTTTGIQPELDRSPGLGNESEEQVCQPDLSTAVMPAPIWARRKGVELVGVSINIPGRSESFSNSDELRTSSPAGQAFMSPIRSLRKILSREKRSMPSPGTGTSCTMVPAAELDVEQGRVETPAS